MQTEAERAATERKRRIEKYFHRTPDKSDETKAILILVCAGILLLLAIIMFATIAVLGVIFLAFAAYAGFKGIKAYQAYQERYRKAEPKPTGAELDALLAADLSRIEKQAMRDLGLTADDLETGYQEWDPVTALGRGGLERPAKRPIMVYGPKIASGFAIGDDRIWRFRSYEVMVICPTHHHLALFRTELSLLTGGLFHQETQEYQYAHVVSVSTRTLPAPNLKLDQTDREKDDRDQVRFSRAMLKQFELGVSSGKSSTVTIGISDEADPEKEAQLQDSGIQQVISSVRRVLRDKKPVS